MSNTGSRGVDEVDLKNNISNWNSCTKVINDQIANLDTDERVIYEELYSYWRTSDFNAAYCKKKIDALKPYDRCHKDKLLAANQEFRRRATFFYTVKESNFKAFREDMQALMGATPAPVRPQSTTTAAAQPTAPAAQPQAETVDEMVSTWRNIVRSIKENQDQLTVIEQTCFEQLENFHQTSADFDPNGSGELVGILWKEVKKRGDNTDMRILLTRFSHLCFNLYAKSEDTYFQFQNTVKPRVQRVNRRPSSTNSGTTASQSRPTSSAPISGSTAVTPESSTETSTTEEKEMTWQDIMGAIIAGLWLLYVLYSFWTEGFWWGIWEAIKSGVLGFILFCSVFAFKKFSYWVAFVGTVAVLFSVFALRGCSNDDNKRVQEKVIKSVPATTVASPTMPPTTYHSISESGLNIRAAANKSARVIGTLQYNQEIQVRKITNGFAEIQYGPGWGYVSTQYLEKGQSKKETTNTSTTKPQTTQKPTSQTSSKPTTTTQPAAKQSQPKQNSTTTQAAPKATTTTQPTPQPAKAKTAADYYKEGVDLAKRFKESEAKASLQKAVDMGSIDAMQYLGMMYVNGGEEATTGFSLVLKAANAGHKEATFQVAELYNAGTGTAKDKAKAKVWYQKAEEMGDGRATSRLRKL